jgi:hypothetical protein
MFILFNPEFHAMITEDVVGLLKVASSPAQLVPVVRQYLLSPEDVAWLEKAGLSIFETIVEEILHPSRFEDDELAEVMLHIHEMKEAWNEKLGREYF